MIDARGLHGWLGTETRFNDWVARRVEEYGFEEGTDFHSILSKSASGRGRPRQDYLLTLDMAKELSMVERTERGRATRRYFIKMEGPRSPLRKAEGQPSGGMDNIQAPWSYMADHRKARWCPA